MNPVVARNPILSFWGLLLVALSLSIGWGIRGNYGHLTGAMFPGALAAIAACLLSARDDWRGRVLDFAFFGAIGWAPGATISYMQVIGYTHSGHWPSIAYGFFALFVIGFLWGCYGGAATAIAASYDRARLQAFYVPLALALVVWTVAGIVLPIIDFKLLEVAGSMRRQDSPLYWFDADWPQVVVTLVALLLFDLVERRFGRCWQLCLLAVAGAAIGWLVQWLLTTVGANDLLWRWLVRPQGDVTRFPAEQLTTNWPNGLPLVAPYLGTILGVVAGVAVYFVRCGRFALGSGLLVSLAVGWLAGFLILPVLLGIRMTPPRADSWAGVLGALVGGWLYLRRTQDYAVILAGLVTGTVGGIGFSGTALLKLLMVRPGNSNVVSDPGTIAHWQHWQSANWHSFLEQTYGFVNGVGLAIALGLLLTRVAPLPEIAPRRRWTDLFALFTVVPWLLYTNMVKNVADWTAKQGTVSVMPERMRMPLFDSIELSAVDWFNVFFWTASAAFMLLAFVQTRKPLAIVPSSWLGRGQLLYFLILWCFVLGNVAKGLPGFTEQRLLTEGMVTLNAVVCTVLILVLPRKEGVALASGGFNWQPLLRRAAIASLVVLAALPVVETAGIRALYGDHKAGHSGHNFRFGPEANWRVQPVLKGQTHR